MGIARAAERCVLGWALVACGSSGSSTIERVSAPAGLGVTASRLDAGDAVGVSGATYDDQGRLWVVTERQHRLLALQPRDPTWTLGGKALLVQGVPEQLELESLAWLADGSFLLGTETGAERSHDTLLFVRVEGAHARVTSSIDVDYARLGLRADGNHGVEGACAVADRVVLAIEQRADDADAVLVVHDLARGDWSTRRLRLTTPTGKLASLDCRAGTDGTIEAIAIERHYGVGRLLRFALRPEDRKEMRVTPRSVLDLAQVVSPLPNFEAVLWRGDEVLLITDNHHGEVTGPTQALRITGLDLVQRPPDGIK